MKHPNGVFLALFILATTLGCGGRASPIHPDGGNAPDGPYLRDDAGNIIYDDGGNPVPLPQDSGPEDAPQGGDTGEPQSDGTVPSQDSGATPGVIECGENVCTVGAEQCCIRGGGTTTCLDLGTPCQGFVMVCDGPEDCSSSTPLCCARLSGPNRGVRCESLCQGTRLCNRDGDCADGERCCGQGTLLGISATWCVPQYQCPNTLPTQGVPCGGTSCLGNTVCCISMGGQTCTPPDACQGTSLACDGPEDCTSSVCCGQFTAGRLTTRCALAGECSGMGTSIVCHSNADCPAGRTCVGLFGTDLRICQ